MMIKKKIDGQYLIDVSPIYNNNDKYVVVYKLNNLSLNKIHINHTIYRDLIYWLRNKNYYIIVL